MLLYNHSIDNKTMLKDCKKIERIAVEYNQLHYFVEKGKGLKFISNIDWVNYII